MSLLYKLSACFVFEARICCSSGEQTKSPQNKQGPAPS